MIKSLFLAHPAAVGETYLEHQAVAFSFATDLLIAGVACGIHALIPALFTRTASRSVERLYDRLVRNRARAEREPSRSGSMAA